MNTASEEFRINMTSAFASYPICHSCGSPVTVEKSNSGWFSECKRCGSQTAASLFADYEKEQDWLYEQFGSNFTFGRSSAPVVPKPEKLKVFISGPMSGYPDYNFAEFRKTAERLEHARIEAVSPEKICQKYTQKAVVENPAALAKMVAEQQAELKKCTAILLLNGWETSNGSRYELFTALKSKLAVFQEKDLPLLESISSYPGSKIGLAVADIHNEDWKTQTALKYGNIPSGEKVLVLEEDYYNFYGGPWTKVAWNGNFYYTKPENIAT